MPAPVPLAELLDHGLTAEARGDRLVVRPRDRITDELRLFIRQHKADILAELQGQGWDGYSGASTEPGAVRADPLQAEALQVLESDPGLKYGIATEADSDPVRVAVAIRGVGAGTLLIPAEKWCPWTFLDILHRKQKVER